MEKINLKKILVCHGVHVNYLEGMFMPDGRVGNQLFRIEEAMKEACKQALELAAKEAEIEYDRDAVVGVDQQSILDVVNLIE